MIGSQVGGEIRYAEQVAGSQLPKQVGNRRGYMERGLEIEWSKNDREVTDLSILVKYAHPDKKRRLK